MAETEKKEGGAIMKAPAKAITVSDYEKNPKLRADRVKTIATLFQDSDRRRKLATLSGGSVNVDQMIEVVLAAVSKTPRIAACSIESIGLAVQEAAELGILPSGAGGLAHLVPFNNGKKARALNLSEFYECKLIPDYKGLVFLARESGSVLTISAGVIYAGQVLGKDWSAREGADDHLWVNPLPPGFVERDEDIAYAWAACKIPAPSAPGGAITQWVLLTRAQIDKIRASSRAADSGPWVTNFPEMAKKSAVKRLSKLAPRRGRFAKAIELEERAEADPEGLELAEELQEASKKGKSRAQQVLESLPAHELTPAGDSTETGQTDLEEAIANAPREPTDEEIAAERAERSEREKKKKG